MKDFAGRLAFVTGGASGIGLAIARTLAERGMKVAIADIDIAALERARAIVPGSIGIVLDVTDRERWESALDEAEAAFGPLAVLVSNAGVAGSRLPIAEIPPAAWEWVRSINLDGTFHALNLGVPRLLRTGQPAHVIVTASLGAMLVWQENGPYSATKAALVALSEALRAELAGTPAGISVLLPSLVRTAILEQNEARAPAGAYIGEREPNLEAAMRAGLDPDRVAWMAAEAIGTDRFWLFTHPETRERVAARAAEIDAAMEEAAIMMAQEGRPEEKS